MVSHSFVITLLTPSDYSDALFRCCNLQLADNGLTANLTIRRPLASSKQLQVTYSVQFIYNGELLGTVSSKQLASECFE